jgi:tetratricopeptide (TPR) repeat protein
MMTLFTSAIALAEALDGNALQALETIEKALQMNPAELSWRPEAIRIRGELRLRLHQAEAAERDFREAVALARQIGSRAWKLRSAMNLTRMLRLRGDIGQALCTGAPLLQLHRGLRHRGSEGCKGAAQRAE